MITYLGILITVLSILVTGLICWQVFSLIKLENYKKEIKSVVDESIKESIKDYGYTVSAIVHQLDGLRYMGLPEKDLNRAFELFIEAIECLNNSKNKEPLEGIVSYIDELITENTKLLKLPDATKDRYVNVCKKSVASKELMNLLNKLNVFQSQFNVTGDNMQGVNINVNKQ